MTAKQFVDAYNYLFKETQDGTYKIDIILNKYDPDGNLDLYEVYDELSAEDEEKIAELLSISEPEEATEPVERTAYDIYFQAWLQDNPDRYAQGVLDFYEALKSEGLINLNYFDDEE